jgi:hypothetical protein
MSALLHEMDLACLDALDPRDWDGMAPDVYAKILEVCVDVAERSSSLGLVPHPPGMQFIRVALLIPNDYVWRPDLSFDRVESVVRETDGYVVSYYGGRTTVHALHEHLRVAVSPLYAARWNESRAAMSDDTLHDVAEQFGVF